MSGPEADLLSPHRLIICCGAGGVGKTTLSAALGAANAAAGRRTLVLTIDPARRLAQALGLELDGTPRPVAPGSLLDACMLDARAELDRSIHRLASDEETARRVLEHPLYRRLSELMAGMQEYAAAEAVSRNLEEGRYEQIILDTAPGRHALDFLETPGRVARFMDERVLRGLARVGGSGAGSWARRAAGAVGGLLRRIVPLELLQDLQSFMGAFGGIAARLRGSSVVLREKLAAADTLFLVVATPDPRALREAAALQAVLAREKFSPGVLVVNRSRAVGRKRRSHLSHADGLSTQTLHRLEVMVESDQVRSEEHARLTRGAHDDWRRVLHTEDAGLSLDRLEGLEALGTALLRETVPGVH